MIFDKYVSTITLLLTMLKINVKHFEATLSRSNGMDWVQTMAEGKFVLEKLPIAKKHNPTEEQKMCLF